MLFRSEEMEKQRQTKHKITILTEEELEKAYTYVELNFGKTYLTPAEEKRMNYLMCRELHRDCSLYFTEGILKNPVKRNYQYEYAVRLKNKNIWLYHDKHRICLLYTAEYGQIAPVYSISAGLDYPGIGPEHAMLYDSGRCLLYTSCSPFKHIPLSKVLDKTICPAASVGSAL